MPQRRWRGSVRRWLADTGPRTTGPPRSSNGASSLHLRWVFDRSDAPAAGRGLVAAEVTLEVVEPPQVPALYFWALQSDLVRGTARGGGAHLGLQWHPGHPASTAVNWGGYAPAGGELAGSRSLLPSATSNPNTRDLRWRPGVPYRLRIERTGPVHGDLTSWRGSVSDLDRGETAVVRDLFAEGNEIAGVVMWSEVFARCDDPQVTVRWSDPVASTVDGVAVVPSGLDVNYQSHAEGGCANSTAIEDSTGVLQRTSTARTTPQGARLATSGASG